MNLLSEVLHRWAKRRRLLVILTALMLLTVTFAALFATRPVASETAASPVPATSSATMRPTRNPDVSRPRPETEPNLAVNEPNTTDHRVMGAAAAEMIYTWDSRSSSFSEVYERVRSWWDVLPDGSNPLTVMAEEFQATGVTAASFASLSGMRAYRTAAVSSLVCDNQLAQFKAHPPPWAGLHVCTFTLKVTERQTRGTNSYSVPVSVMVNCPPAVTAPANRCAMVGFYASSERIVY